MPSINMTSILNKAETYMNSAKGKKRINKLVDDIIIGRVSFLSNGTKVHSPSEAASKFIEVLRNEISSSGIAGGGDFASGQLGDTAVSALSKLEYGVPRKVAGKEYAYSIDVYFTEDLHRESLAPEHFSEGVHNIAALLDKGYTAGHAVYGVWKGHHDNKMIRSLQSRGGAGFIDRAVSTFMNNYAADYGVVDIIIDDLYT